MLQAHLITSTYNSLTIQLGISGKISSKAELIIIIYQGNVKLQTHEVKQPFPLEYTINDLNHQSIYVLKLRLENYQTNKLQTLHASTKADPNNVINTRIQKYDPQPVKIKANSEQQLIEILAAENDDFTLFESKQQIQNMVIKARKNTNSLGFINSEYRICRPPELKEERFKRIWAISKGQQFYDETYGHRPGQTFMKNDWFMGPFYSYDNNEQKLKEEQHKANLLI